MSKLWAPKVEGIPTVIIHGLPFGSLGTKCHLDVAPVERRKEYYKRKGGDFPQVRIMVSLMSLRLLVILTPKMFKLCTNQLVVWFV